MKKYLRIVAIILLFTMSIPIFASCGTINGAQKLKALLLESDKYYASGQQAEAKTTVTMTGTVEGVKVSSSGELKQTITSVNTDQDSFEYLDKSSSISKTNIGDGEETVEEYSSIFGFVDQHIIQARIPANGNGGDEASYLKSPCTVGDFREFLNWRETEMYPKLSEHGLGKTVSIKNSNNFWHVKITGVKKESQKQLEDFINASIRSTALECSITDFSLSMTIDIKTCAVVTEQLELKAVCTMEEDINYDLSISSEVKYSLPDAGTDLTPKNFSDYTETGDLRYIDYAIHSISELNEFSKNLSFDFSTSTNFLTTSESGKYLSSSKYEETDTVNCGVKDGKFVYHIKANASNGGTPYDITISYDGKQQSIAVGSQYPQKNLKSEAESKAYLSSSMFQSMIFDNDEVIDLSMSELSGKKVIVLTLVPDQRVKKMFASVGTPVNTKFESISAKLTFTFSSENDLISVFYSAGGRFIDSREEHTLRHSANISNIKDADLSMITVIK